MKNVLIIGASSGIGKELALQYADLGFQVTISARNVEKLKEIVNNTRNIKYEYIDITNINETIGKLKSLMNDIDIVIISAGIGNINENLDFNIENETITTNITGFTAAITTAFNSFKSQKKQGHIVAISSIASLRGSDLAPAYNASKAYVSNYLEGLNKKSVKENLGIKVTNVIPGLVDTQMAKGEGLFWVESTELIAKEIIKGIKNNKSKLVVSKRWKLIALLLKLLPDKLYFKL